MHKNSAAALGRQSESRPGVEANRPQNTPTQPPAQDCKPRLHSAFRASPDCWPGVDPLHNDPLGDDSLFAAPTLFRVTISGTRFLIDDAGELPPATIDRLAFIVGGQDFGIVCPPNYGEADAYAVIRARDLETLLDLAEFEPLTCLAPV